MEKKYLAKIIATENEGLQMISACCAGAKVKKGWGKNTPSKLNGKKIFSKNYCKRSRGFTNDFCM